MKHAPFRFVDRPHDVSNLVRGLEGAGLESPALISDLPSGDPNRYSALLLRCRWISEQVEVRFFFAWWPDGVASELQRVEMRRGGGLVAAVEVRSFERPGLQGSLSERIIEWVVQEAGSITGRRGLRAC